MVAVVPVMSVAMVSFGGVHPIGVATPQFKVKEYQSGPGCASSSNNMIASYPLADVGFCINVVKPLWYNSPLLTSVSVVLNVPVFERGGLRLEYLSDKFQLQVGIHVFPFI